VFFQVDLVCLSPDHRKEGGQIFQHPESDLSTLQGQINERTPVMEGLNSHSHRTVFHEDRLEINLD
jgi:hypothetical protein